MADRLDDVEQLRQLLETTRREKEEAEAQAEAYKARAEVFEQREAHTPLLNFISAIERDLFATLAIEPDPGKTSTRNSATSVEGRYYPQHFRPWAEFPAIHAQRFDRFLEIFGNNAHFPSLNQVRAVGSDLSPRVSDELDVRGFIRAAIEKPAAVIVSKYLEITRHPTIRAVKFRSNSYGLNLETGDALESLAEYAPEPAPKRPSPTRRIGVPDRWLLAFHRDERVTSALVGEYKAAHSLPSRKISSVLASPVADDFFARAAKQDGSSTSGGVPGNVYVAKVICQAYHYMITSGLEFGYVTSGSGLILLRVPEEDPNTLYYFWSVFPMTASREPRETTLAYLATLCICSTESTPRPSSWIDAREEDLRRWPRSNALAATLSETPPSMGSHGRDRDDGGDGTGGESAKSTAPTQSQSDNNRKHLKRRQGSKGTGSSPTAGGASRTHRVSSEDQLVPSPSELPYCTQACLYGLCRGLPLDSNCPNIKLHRSSAEPDHHALTADEARSLITAQLAENMDNDCECLDQYGCWGRYGVLFKITVTGFGYTLVAKAVQAQHRHMLVHETTMYRYLGAFQGQLIPVCLGLVDLQRPIPLHSCARVAHMMLLSYVGPDLNSRKALPSGIDFDMEAERSTQELLEAGMWNEDVRDANLAWSRETGRVMLFDFDQAHIEAVAPIEKVALASRSPLETKRGLNVVHDGNDHDEHGQTKKRARISGV